MEVMVMQCGNGDSGVCKVMVVVLMMVIMMVLVLNRQCVTIGWGKL